MEDPTNQARENFQDPTNDFTATTYVETLGILQISHVPQAKMALHKECDFFVKNFEVRQKALADEIEALGQAAAILSGAK